VRVPCPPPARMRAGAARCGLSQLSAALGRQRARRASACTHLDALAHCGEVDTVALLALVDRDSGIGHRQRAARHQRHQARPRHSRPVFPPELASLPPAVVPARLHTVFIHQAHEVHECMLRVLLAAAFASATVAGTVPSVTGADSPGRATAAPCRCARVCCVSVRPLDCLAASNPPSAVCPWRVCARAWRVILLATPAPAARTRRGRGAEPYWCAST